MNSNGEAKSGGHASAILVVEDDPHTAEIVRLYLQREGHAVNIASDGPSGLELARRGNPDLIVLDLMLPGMDGLEICRALRADAVNTPIIMLTARVEERDRIVGLDWGADDYVTKPFSPRELVSRVRAVLRRSRGPGSPEQPARVLSHGEIKVDLSTRTVTVGDRPVALTPTEYRLLLYFMRSPGQVLTRTQMIERVFGDSFEGFDRTLDTHISNLRRKLSDRDGARRVIHTVYGVGYRFGNA